VQIVLTVDDESEKVVSAQARSLLEFVVLQNRWLMHTQPRIPPLYQSGVRFRMQPWAARVQHFATCVQVLQRGWSDCGPLGAWRVAEVQEAAIASGHPELVKDIGLHIYCRIRDRDGLHAGLGDRAKIRIFHVQVIHPNGAIEDPSRLLHQ
jgi:hypothetical protein